MPKLLDGIGEIGGAMIRKHCRRMIIDLCTGVDTSASRIYSDNENKVSGGAYVNKTF
jgi:hypothetical protein